VWEGGGKKKEIVHYKRRLSKLVIYWEKKSNPLQIGMGGEKNLFSGGKS